MVEKYLKILKQLRFSDDCFMRYKEALHTYDYAKTAEETFSWICTVLALKAASKNNLGVGAILVQENKILYDACNEMLHPYFRSDGHPEMMVLSNYEKKNKHRKDNMRSLTLYSSLEPCPMCLTRISTTGIGAAVFVARHQGSGMATCIDKLPILWQIFCEDIKIAEASCSDKLKTISLELLNVSAQKNVPAIFTYKEGVLPEKRMGNYLKNL